MLKTPDFSDFSRQMLHVPHAHLALLAATLWLPSSAYGSPDAAQISGGVFSAEAWASVLSGPGLIALLTLAALEIVLGIDNIVFLTVLTARLPEEQRDRARRLGLIGAMVSRIALLVAVGWLMRLTEPLFQLPWVNADAGVSGKDLILLLGGMFLLGKATKEIHNKVEHKEEAAGADPKPADRMSSVLFQVMLMDMVFSLDSVVTAVGMTQNIPVMILAVVASVVVMMFAAGPIGDFVERHPAVKILALAFLVLIGALLIAEGFGRHVEKGYIYFAMAFSLTVELLQLRMEKRRASSAGDSA